MAFAPLASEAGKQAAGNAAKPVRPVAPKTGKPHPRTYQTEDFAIFKQAVVALGIASPDLAYRLGYTANVYGNWEAAGKMPMVAAVACKALIALKKAEAASTLTYNERLLFLRVKDGDQEQALSTLCKALKIDLIPLTP